MDATSWDEAAALLLHADRMQRIQALEQMQVRAVRVGFTFSRHRPHHRHASPQRALLLPPQTTSPRKQPKK